MPPRTRAELVDGEWVINGAKAFITNSGTAITSVVTVTRDAPGRTRSRRSWCRPARPASPLQPAYDKLGWRISDTHGLTFDDCRVPEANLLGARGQRVQAVPRHPGRRPDRHLRAGGRAWPRPAWTSRCATPSSGPPSARRSAPARPWRSRSATWRSPVEAARLLTYKAAWLKDAGRPADEVKQAAAIAKLYSTEAAVTATRTATQVFGGYGFMEEYPGRPLLPGRQDPGDRRRHLRGAAHADRPRPRPAGLVSTASLRGQASSRT